MINRNHTIIALSTPPGLGALAVIRLSGKDAIRTCNAVFKGKDLEAKETHTIHYGYIMDEGEVVDEVMVSIFKSPRSFTTEDMVEISCHGSPFIAQKIISLFIRKGVYQAQPGEFTFRAFVNGRIDLSQAEAVADMIHADSEAALKLAVQQMRGGFAKQIQELRQQLIDYKALIELELDFSEEDVEFANRERLVKLLKEILAVVIPLAESFKSGNVIKNGLQTVIAGKPNAGKSTLLNALLKDERAIVSDIAGTTRDTIEEVLHLQGVSFRFIDTAGLRKAGDEIERIGIQKTHASIENADILIMLFDVKETTSEEVKRQFLLYELKEKSVLVVGNKSEGLGSEEREKIAECFAENGFPVLFISAKEQSGIEELKRALVQIAEEGKNQSAGSVVVSNIRHYESLIKSKAALEAVVSGVEEGLSGELLSLDLRNALDALGEISGVVSNEEILGSIFGRFCIGK